MKTCLHLVALSAEVAALVALVSIPLCNSLPLSDRCYSSTPREFSFGLASEQDELLSNLQYLRVDYTTKEHPERDSNPRQMISLKFNYDKRYERFAVTLPKHVLDIGVSFHFKNGLNRSSNAPRLSSWQFGDVLLSDVRLEDYRNYAFGFPALYYHPKPRLNGYAPYALAIGSGVWLAIVFLLWHCLWRRVGL